MVYDYYDNYINDGIRKADMEDLKDWIKALGKSGKAIIVEGPKDKKALERFGVKKIFVLSKKSLLETAEDIASKYNEVIILTDLDKKGRELYGKLSKDLNKLGVKIDKKFREWLFKNTDLRQIEGLESYLKNSRLKL